MMMAIAVVLLIILAGLVLFTYNLINSQSPPTTTETVVLSQEFTTKTVATGQNFQESETSSVDNGLTMPEGQSTTTVSIQGSSLISPTVSSNSLKNDVLGSGFCVVKVKEDDFLSSILGQFDLQVSEDKQYYYFLTCSEDPQKCSDKQKILDNNAIEIDHWILIDEVNSEACSENPAGVWIFQVE